MLSVVVISYNIKRELPRTIFSLSPKFQKDIDPEKYEVIVVDNGSDILPDVNAFKDFGLDIRLFSVTNPTSSPSRAINIGIKNSYGEFISIFIDGARLASPGLLSSTLEALHISNKVVVGSYGRYLGMKYQRDNMLLGYNQMSEDKMLSEINWKNNGYKLFEHSVFDESSGDFWLDPIAESNSITMSRECWNELGGYSEEFISAGGGFVNLDTWKRACNLPNIKPVVLLGEATFHQFHNGVATNAHKNSPRPLQFHNEYIKIRGEKYSKHQSLFFYGRIYHNEMK